MYLYLDSEIKTVLHDPNTAFQTLMDLKGEVVRALENRSTQRILLNKKPYFIKQHFGVGWREIVKNILQGRLPVLSAKNEYLAIQSLKGLAIATPRVVGYGYKGINPATLRSFLLTQELPPFVTLEDLTRSWSSQKPRFSFKLALIQEVARISRILHANGINHRDFYICHFLLDLLEYSKQVIKLYLIDLHRAQIRHRTPRRWIVKDIAGLYFSSRDIGLTQRDLLRFIRCYRQQPLREVLTKESRFWHKVKKRGDKLYRRHEKRSI